MGEHSGTDRSHTKESPANIEVKNSAHKALQRSELEVNPEVDLLLRKYTGQSSMTTPQKDTAKIYIGGFIRQPSENVALSPDISRNQEFPTPNHPSSQKKTTTNFVHPNPGPLPAQIQKFPQKEERVMSFKYSDRDLSDIPSQNLDETYQSDLKKALSIAPFKTQFPGATILSKSDVRTKYSVQNVSDDPNVQYIKYFENPTKLVVCKISVNQLLEKPQSPPQPSNPSSIPKSPHSLPPPQETPPRTAPQPSKAITLDPPTPPPPSPNPNHLQKPQTPPKPNHHPPSDLDPKEPSRKSSRSAKKKWSKQVSKRNSRKNTENLGENEALDKCFGGQNEIYFRNSLNRRLYEEENMISEEEGRRGGGSIASRLWEEQRKLKEENFLGGGEKKQGFDRDDIRRI